MVALLDVGANSSAPRNGRFKPASEIREGLVLIPTSGSNGSNAVTHKTKRGHFGPRLPLDQITVALTKH